MSELTPCNRCTLAAIEARAKRTGRVVTLLADRTIGDASTMRGTVVLVHGPDEAPDEARHWVAWLWVISEECAC